MIDSRTNPNIDFIIFCGIKFFFLKLKRSLSGIIEKTKMKKNDFKKSIILLTRKLPEKIEKITKELHNSPEQKLTKDTLIKI